MFVFTCVCVCGGGDGVGWVYREMSVHRSPKKKSCDLWPLWINVLKLVAISSRYYLQYPTIGGDVLRHTGIQPLRVRTFGIEPTASQPASQPDRQPRQTDKESGERLFSLRPTISVLSSQLLVVSLKNHLLLSVKDECDSVCFHDDWVKAHFKILFAANNTR